MARLGPGRAATGARAISLVTGPTRSTGSNALAIGQEMIEKWLLKALSEGRDRL